MSDRDGPGPTVTVCKVNSVAGIRGRQESFLSRFRYSVTPGLAAGAANSRGPLAESQPGNLNPVPDSESDGPCAPGPSHWQASKLTVLSGPGRY